MQEVQKIRALIIEDNPPDAIIIQEYLLRGPERRFDLVKAADLDEGLDKLSRGDTDIILLDLALPDCEGHETFERAHSQAPGTPIIVLTSRDDEELAVTMLKEGAQDYLVKGHFDAELLKRAIRYSIERAKSERELQKAYEELDAFAHTVSHDLKGPLSAIYYAGLIVEDALEKLESPDQRNAAAEATQCINGSARECFTLIEDILSTAESMRSPLTNELIDVREVVDQVLSERSSELDRKHSRVMVRGDLGTMMANRTHIYQLFSNLVNNALKHCDNPEPEIMIACLSSDDGSGYRYLVKDNGTGIQEEMLEQIFQPFYSGGSGGTGIGLSIVKKIVDLYGGDIRAYNDDGACFEFVFHAHQGKAAANEGDGRDARDRRRAS